MTPEELQNALRKSLASSMGSLIKPIEEIDVPPNEKLELEEYKAQLRAIELLSLNQKNQLFQQKIDDAKKNSDKRYKYSDNIFELVKCWLVFIGLIVLFDGMNILPFKLNDTVLISLITTTTGTIFGLFYLVIKYFFPGDNELGIRIDTSYKKDKT